MIIFTKRAYQKLKYFTVNFDREISGLGRSQIIDSNTIRITDIEIFPQHSTFGGTTLDEEYLAKFLYKQTLQKKKVSDINVWWHSHADMSVFWSGTDESTIETTTSNAYLVSLVINRKLDILGRLDIFKPFRFEIPLDVHIPKIKYNKQTEQYCVNKIKSCVKIPFSRKISPKLENMLEQIKKEVPGFQITYQKSISNGKKTFSIPSDFKSLSHS